MAEEQIRNIVSEEAFKQVERLQGELKAMAKTLEDAIVDAKAFDAVLRAAKGLKQLERAIAEGVGAQKKLAEAGEAVITTTKRIQKTQKAAADSLLAYKNRVRELEREYNLLGNAQEFDIRRKEQIRKELINLAAAHGVEKKALNDAKRGVDAAEKSYYELQNATNELQKRLKSLPGAFDATTGAVNKNNKEAVIMAEQIKKNNDLLKKYDASLGQHFRNVGNYATVTHGIRDFTTSLLGFASAGFLAAQATRAVIDSNVEISDSLSQVQRVGKLTDKELQDLYDSLKLIDTRTTLSGLLELSRIGAQLGVAKEDLAGFTTALNELTVTLGKEIQGGPEAIAEALGKINNLLDISQRFGVEEGLRKTGSAILAVGQAGLATGDYLADFAERVGGVAKIAGVSLPTILAYGAALQANGVTTELAGTNFQRLIVQMGRVPEKFYEIAKAANPNLGLQQYIDLVNNDATKALDLFFRGLGKSTDKLTEFSKLTKSIGLPGQRAAQILSAIATSADDVAKFVGVANEAFSDGAIIDDQYAIVNDNLAGSIAQLRNEAAKLVTDPNSNIGQFFKNIVLGAKDAIKQVDNFLGEVKDLYNQLFNRKQFNADIKKEAQAAAAAQAEAFFGVNESFAKEFAGKDRTEQLKILNQQQALLKQSLAQFHRAVTTPGADVKAITEQLERDKDLVDRLERIYNAPPTNPVGAPAGGPAANTPAQAKAAANKRLSELHSEAQEQIVIDKAKRDALLKNQRQEADAEYDLAQERLAQQVKVNEDIFNDDQKSLDDRLDAFRKYLESQKSLIESEKQQQLFNLQSGAEAEALERKQRQALLDARKKKDGKLNDTEAAAIIAGVHLTDDEIEAVSQGLAKQKAVIIEKANDKLALLLKDTGRQTNSITLSVLGISSANAGSEIQAAGDQALAALNDLYAQRLITEKEFNKRREEIEYRTNVDILQNQIETAKKALEAAEAAGINVAQAREHLASLEMQLSDATTEHIIGNEGRRRQEMLNTLEAVRQYGDQFLGVIGSAIDNSVTAQKNILQDQIDDINKRKEAEIEAVNESLLSQQEKADKISIINQRAQAQTEAIARRQKQLDQQKAKFDKAKAIFDIIVGTASAVVEALPNIPLSVLVGFLGAAELAVASSAPIPTYWKGRKDGPAEWAIVGERGTEMITTKDGKQALTPDRPTLTFLPEHAIVTPHNETLIELAKQNAMSAMTNVPRIEPDTYAREYIAALEKQTEALQRTLNGIPQTNFTWSERGVTKWVRRGASKTVWINGVTG